MDVRWELIPNKLWVLFFGMWQWVFRRFMKMEWFAEDVIESGREFHKL